MKVKSKLFYSYVILLLIYSAFLLIPKPPLAILKQYELSVTGVRLLDLAIIILLAIIWFAGFYSYSKLRNYVSSIKDYKDGQHIAKLCQGMFWLALWLPVSETLSTVLNFFALRHPKLLTATTIINNYVSLALPLVAFVLISLGARRLSRFAKLKPQYLTLQAIVIFLVYIGLTYAHLVASTPGRGTVYHLSIWLLLTTIVAPYIYMWLTGLYAIYLIFLYQIKVPGVVYRRSWSLLSLGLGWILLMTIVFQFLITLSAHLMKLSIYGLLGIVFGLLLILSVGYLLVAAGTRRLATLEAV